MNENYKDLIGKLDDIKKDTTDIKIEQAKQGKDIEKNTADLAEHIRRTELAEAAIKENTDKILAIENRSFWDWLKENGKTILVAVGLIGAIIGFLEWFLLYLMSNQ